MPAPGQKHFSVAARRQMVRRLMDMDLPEPVIKAVVGSIQTSDRRYIETTGDESTRARREQTGRMPVYYKATLHLYAEMEEGRPEEIPGLHDALADYLDIAHLKHTCSVILTMMRTVRGSVAYCGYRLLLTSLFGDGHFLPDMTGSELLSAYLAALCKGEATPGSQSEMTDLLARWAIRYYAEGINALPITDKAVRYINDSVLGFLPPRLEEVITLRFGLKTGKPLTSVEVGEQMGVSDVRVRQLEYKAIRLLRFPGRRKFMPMLALPISSIADEIIDRELWRTRPVRLDRDLYCFGLPSPVLNLLQKNGIKTIGQLQRASELDLSNLWMQMPEARTAPDRTLERLLIEINSILAGMDLSLAKSTLSYPFGCAAAIAPQTRFEFGAPRTKPGAPIPFSEFWDGQATPGSHRPINLYWLIADVGLVLRGEKPCGEKLAESDLIEYVAFNAVLDFQRDCAGSRGSQLIDEYFYRYLPIILSPFASGETIARVEDAVRRKVPAITTLLDSLAGKVHLSRLNDAEIMISAIDKASPDTPAPPGQRLVLGVWELLNFDHPLLMRPQ
jgi:hypothetical protein